MRAYSISSLKPGNKYAAAVDSTLHLQERRTEGFPQTRVHNWDYNPKK